MTLVPLNLSPSSLQVRLFGALWVPAILSVSGLKLHGHYPRLAMLCLGLAVACELATWIAPIIVRKVLVVITVLFYPVNWVVSHFLLVLLYFGVLTPIALVVRLLRIDPLKLRRDPTATSYWIPRKRVIPLRRYFRQY
jgi:hypothetical protein